MIQSKKNSSIFLTGSVAVFSLFLAYQCNNDPEKQPRVNLKLNDYEEKILLEMKNNPLKIQEWINQEVTYKTDKEQFKDNFCKNNNDYCDIWNPIAHLLRTKEGDCDEIFTLAHYLLNKSGVGIFLEDKQDLNRNHYLYAYKEKNGFYGVISINSSEFRLPQYETLDKLANLLRKPEHDSYQVIKFTTDDNLLVYSFATKNKSSWGNKIKLP